MKQILPMETKQDDEANCRSASNCTLDHRARFSFGPGGRILGRGAVDELGLASRTKKFRVLLNLSSGGSNPDEVRRLRGLKYASVRSLRRLHAKAYIGDNEIVVGSANASTNGLGSEGTENSHWRELGILTSETDVVDNAHKWFEEQWKVAEPVTDDALGHAEKLWEKRKKIRPDEMASYSSPRELLAAAIDAPENFKKRGIYVVATCGETSDEANAQISEMEKERGGSVYAWEGWTDIPKMAKLISFTYDEQEGFQVESPSVYFSGEGEQVGLLTVVQKSNIEGYKIGPISKWKSALTRARKSKSPQVWVDGDGICMDLGDFAAAFGRK